MVHDRLAERALLRESVERFVSRSYDIETRNALAQTAPGFRADHWATFAELGWLAIRIPEELDGIGGSFADAAVIIEEFGRGLLLEPFTSNAIFSAALLADGATAPAAAAALAELGEGTLQVATAYREAGDGCDPRAAAARLGDGDGGLVLDGTKIGVPFATSAGRFIVSARDTADALQLVLIDRNAGGVSIDERVAIDGTRSATVTFAATPVAPDGVLPIGDPERALAGALDAADAALCAEAVGVTARAYHDAAAYVRERLQFGRAIATFQVVRHRIVDMFVELELARAAAAQAAEAIDTADGAERAHAVSAAKIQIIRSSRFVCDGAVQLHGAIGIAAEAAPAHALARVTGIAATFGDLIYHRNRYLATREGTTP